MHVPSRTQLRGERSEFGTDTDAMAGVVHHAHMPDRPRLAARAAIGRRAATTIMRRKGAEARLSILVKPHGEEHAQRRQYRPRHRTTS